MKLTMEYKFELFCLSPLSAILRIIVCRQLLIVEETRVLSITHTPSNHKLMQAVCVYISDHSGFSDMNRTQLLNKLSQKLLDLTKRIIDHLESTVCRKVPYLNFIRGIIHSDKCLFHFAG